MQTPLDKGCSGRAYAGRQPHTPTCQIKQAGHRLGESPADAQQQATAASSKSERQDHDMIHTPSTDQPDTCKPRRTSLIFPQRW